MSDEPRRLQRATAAPASRAQALGPGRLRLTKAGTPYRIDVFPGTHTAIALGGTGTEEIVSNNPNVSSSSDEATWLTMPPNGGIRRVFFHVKGTRSSDVDTTLFLLNRAEAGKRAVFQVRRVPFPPMSKEKKGRILLSLNGLSVALNQDDGKIIPYRLKHSIRVPNSMAHGEALDLALAAAGSNKIRHLVINAHGGHGRDLRGEIELGDHFHHGNLDSWKRLSGKVDYIWLQNCKIGFDREFLSGISRRTGAWVAAPSDFPLESISTPKDKLDYVPRIYVYSNHDLFGGTPVGIDDFLRSARSRADANLDDAVAFLLESPT